MSIQKSAGLLMISLALVMAGVGCDSEDTATEPTIVATSTPTPVPTPTPKPCVPPTKEQNLQNCQYSPEQGWPYYEIIKAARSQVIALYGDWFFEYDDGSGNFWTQTRNAKGYIQALRDTIKATPGYSAHGGFYEDVTHVEIKKNDIDLSAGYMMLTTWGVSQAYAYTCRPASFCEPN
jgi:hypothetical protein